MSQEGGQRTPAKEAAEPLCSAGAPPLPHAALRSVLAKESHLVLVRKGLDFKGSSQMGIESLRASPAGGRKRSPFTKEQAELERACVGQREDAATGLERSTNSLWREGDQLGEGWWLGTV